MGIHPFKRHSVVVVDDHELVRTGISSLLKGIESVQVIAQAANGEEAIEIAQNKKPDLILMDLRMPGIGGLQATINILRSNSQIKIIALSICNDDLFPTKLLQAGAHGYLTKNSNRDELKFAIEQVMNNKRYISPEIASKLALRHLTEQENSIFESLSERELQVTLMITKGMKVQEISELLFLSPKTVNSYRYRIYEKLEVRNDVELTRLALKHNITESLHDSM